MFYKNKCITILYTEQSNLNKDIYVLLFSQELHYFYTTFKQETHMFELEGFSIY